MHPDTVERKLTAILCADVAGYSRLLADDEAATIRALSAYREQIGVLVRQHRGRVVDAPGDNLLAEFPSALDAARCAVEVQRVLEARNADVPPDRRLEFRVGVHVGDVTMEGERIYGEGVNIAARLEGLAEPGGITLSAAVWEQVRNRLRVDVEDLGERTLKNIPQPVRAYRVRLRTDNPAETPAAAPGALTGLGGRPDIAVFVVPAVWVLYVAIVFEILFMISPFALYYYSTYGPSLNFLQGSPRTAWLADFFLPHFSQTSSPVLNWLPGVGRVLIVGGMTVFAVSFVHIYLAKVRGRGVVARGPYAVVRHPQYLALAVVGLGTLLFWPRFLVLVTYITMLFLYAVMARWEEQMCLRNFGESYRTYQERTGMFFRRGLPRLLPPRGGGRVLALSALYVVVIVAAVALGFRLRDYSLSRVSASYGENVAVLSPALLTDEERDTAVEVASAGERVREELAAAGPDAKLLVYVVPLEWRLPDLPMEPPAAGEGGHHEPADFDRRLYKVLFTKVRTHAAAARDEEIVKTAYGRDPIVLVKVNNATREITGIEQPPAHVRWGDIPTPLF